MKIEIANIISALRVDASRSTLLDALDKVDQLSDPDSSAAKLKAELCYLLAREYAIQDAELAEEYAQRSKQLYNQIQVDSFEEAAPLLDWLLPSLMHEGVVERDFSSKK